MRSQEEWYQKLSGSGVPEQTARTLAGEIKVEINQAAENTLRRFAWWKDGVQYAPGTDKTTLKKALEELKNERD